MGLIAIIFSGFNITGAIIGSSLKTSLLPLIGIVSLMFGGFLMFGKGNLERRIIRKCGDPVGGINYSKDVDLNSIISRPPARVMSEEEIKKRDEEFVRGDVTPELLKYFSQKTAEELVKYFQNSPNVSTQRDGAIYNLYELVGKDLDYLEKEVKGKKVIEFGDAGKKINKTFFEELGSKKFIAFDTLPGKGRDALSQLSRQPDNSAVVTSFGVLDEGVLYMGGVVEGLERYTEELAKQIYRVTPLRGLTIHGLENAKDLINAGFIPEKVLRGQAHHRLMTFRKPKK